MIPALNTLKQGLARTKFDSAEIKEQVMNLVDTLSSDLTGAGYEAGVEVEDAVNKLTEALDDADESTESLSDLDSAAAEGATLEDEDE